jgi:hypothetical protein
MFRAEQVSNFRAEQIAYLLGQITADIILFSLMPTSGFAAYKAFGKFADFAYAHRLRDKSPEAISDNLFECLPYID